MLQAGIIGLPNVGKSTLFNALLRRQQAMVANYPFATIEPNVGIIPVPDERLTKLQEVIGPGTPIVPATVQFVDIAGLVKGAAEGAGLGNKFLAHIREVDLICEVVRAFPDSDVIREGSTEPKSDMEIINTELILADLQTLEKSKEKSVNLEALKQKLDRGELAGEAGKEFQLLTAKKFVYIFNVNTASEWEGLQETVNSLRSEGKSVVVVDAKLEAELAVLSPDEQEEYLESLGVTDSGVNALIREAYSALDLISFLTAGEKEVRAWPIPKGTKAPQAAGTIHTDFEKNFIKADVVSFEEFIKNNGWKMARENGKVRSEGRDYTMADGDVVEFRVNV